MEELSTLIQPGDPLSIETDIKDVRRALYESDIRDVLFGREDALKRDIRFHMTKKNVTTDPVRIHKKPLLSCANQSAIYEFSEPIDMAQERNMHQFAVQKAAGEITGAMKNILLGLEKDGYSGVYYKLRFDQSTGLVSGTLRLYKQTRADLFNEIRDELNAMELSNASHDDVRSYLVYTASSIFTS